MTTGCFIDRANSCGVHNSKRLLDSFPKEALDWNVWPENLVQHACVELSGEIRMGQVSLGIGDILGVLDRITFYWGIDPGLLEGVIRVELGGHLEFACGFLGSRGVFSRSCCYRCRSADCGLDVMMGHHLQLVLFDVVDKVCLRDVAAGSARLDLARLNVVVQKIIPSRRGHFLYLTTNEVGLGGEHHPLYCLL